MRRTRAENASFVIAAIRALGIEPHPESRLMRMCRVLTEATGTIQPGDPAFETAREAERDMQHFGFVFDQIHAYRDRTEFRFLVKRMLKDSVLPQKDRRHSPGRDSQFELFVAAVCQSAGLIPVDYQEPDVTCMVEETKYGIAAKRLKTVSALEEHVRKAAKQIQKAGLPGIIALDTCLALNPGNKPILARIPDDQFGALYKQELHRFLDRHHRRIYDGSMVKAFAAWCFTITRFA